MPDQSSSGTGPLAGEPRERGVKTRPSTPARVGTGLTWWVLLMSFWVMIDDSLNTDELLAGAGAAAIAAVIAELVTYQAETRLRIRLRWLPSALRLPGAVVSDMITVYAALWRRLARGEQPDSAFVTEPVRFGNHTPEDMTRRVLILGARSLAPNAFALGIDDETDTMVLHELVRTDKKDKKDKRDRGHHKDEGGT